MSEPAHPPEPTAEQCSRNEELDEFDGKRAFAAWYPQMGGYAGKAVVVVDDGCFDVWVWHDGDFPFSPDGSPPRESYSPRLIHHCSAEQFISFGKELVQIGLRSEW